MTEEILIKLTTIGALEKGQTLSTCYETPVQHKSWSTTFSRTLNGEHRKKTINYIQDVISEAKSIVESLKDEEGIDILKNLIKESLIGVENLKTTYKSDYYIIGMINTLIEDTTKWLTTHKMEVIESTDHRIFFDAIKNIDYVTLEDYLYDGKEANLKTEKLQNGLHLVADKGYYNLKILNILLNFNVDVHAKDIDGHTPLYYAISTGNAECVIKLEEYISKKKPRQ